MKWQKNSTQKTYCEDVDAMCVEDVECGLDSSSRARHPDDASQSSKYWLSSSITSRRTGSLMVVLLLIVGAAAGALFMFIGITGAHKDQDREFDRTANEMVHALEMAVDDYLVAASFIQTAASWQNVSRQEFRMLFYNMKMGGLNVPMVSHNPMVMNEARSDMEDHSKAYYEQEYPDMPYKGMQGLEPAHDYDVKYRSEQPHYFPSLLIEPVEGNEQFVDFDLNSIPEIERHIDQMLETWEPAITQRIGDDPSDYSVMLLHPGVSVKQIQEMEAGELDGEDMDHGHHGHLRKLSQEYARRSMQDMIGDHGMDHGNMDHSTMEHGNTDHGNMDPSNMDPSNMDNGDMDQDISHGHGHGITQAEEAELELPRATSFTAVRIHITDLLQRLMHFPPREKVFVYLYSSSDEYLCGVEVSPADDHVHHRHNSVLEFQPPIPKQELSESWPGSKTRQQKFFPITSSKQSDQGWTVYVIAARGTYESDTTVVVTAGVLLFLSCVTLGAFIYGNIRRVDNLNKLEAQAQQEKAALTLDNARNSAKRERDLNDFIAHEVRNPLAAAMSACSFVSSEVLDEQQPMIPAQRYESVKEDFEIIASSLHFINDLLRNMLDMQRAGSNQLKIEKAPTHIMNDILRPVDCMLHRRGANFEVHLECDIDDLVVMTDPLRLKQIILNLARNSVKFVERGFIRLKATTVPVVDGGSTKSTRSKKQPPSARTVRIFVDDSGPGIPKSKREQLFAKFQETLDSLHQGTGIGLSLCKQLTTLMGARLWIDETYDSGVPGYPGCRFVVDLNIPPLEWNDDLLEQYEEGEDTFSEEDCRSSLSTDASRDFEAPVKMDMSTKAKSEALSRGSSHTLTTHVSASSVDLTGEDGLASSTSSRDSSLGALPEELSVLFVDDDMVLRKLFVRSVRKLAPKWAIQEAGNGEAALSITKTETFDVIFMDQYMASVQKQLLGTEATRALRAQGVTAKICGLSANDAEQSFLEAGADSFMMKPFPCKPDALRKELVRVVNTDRNSHAAGASSIKDTAIPSTATPKTAKSVDSLTLTAKPLFSVDKQPTQKDKAPTVAPLFSLPPVAVDKGPAKKGQMATTTTTRQGQAVETDKEHVTSLNAPFPNAPFPKANTGGGDLQELPHHLSVLFVDDDKVLRKLFSRSVRKVGPNWNIQDAECGEDALEITKATHFDIIFMDQYMASVEKRLLGTETTKALREQGVTAKICGLSANDVKDAFLEHGADLFMMKPFPFKADPLKTELLRVLNTKRINVFGDEQQQDMTVNSSARSSSSSSGANTSHRSAASNTGLSAMDLWVEHSERNADDDGIV